MNAGAPITKDGAILGTVAYMSPEQAEGKTVDGRSDIFSFGAMLYEMVSGRSPFHGSSAISTLAAILHEDPKPVSELTPGLPREIDRIVARCLRKDPARRWQSMVDLRTSLQECKEDSDSGVLHSGTASRPTEPRAASGRRWVWGAAALLGLSFIGAVWFLRSPQPAETALTAVPLTSHNGFEESPSFAPDGNHVAYSWNGPNENNTDIYIKLIGPGDPLRLTTDPARDISPAWSPDGRWIAFVRFLPGARAGYFLIPALGGPERKVGETWSEPFLNSVPRPLIAWSPDGKWLAVPDKDTPNGDFGLFLVSVATGEKRRLTTPVRGGSDSGAAFSPDGRTLAFVRREQWGLTRISLLSLSSNLGPQGEPKVLPSPEPDNYGPAWTPDGKELVFSSGTFRGTRNLWRIAVSGSAEARRLAGVGERSGLVVSIWRPTAGQAARMVYQQISLDTDVWRIELSRTGSSVGSPSRFLSSSRQDFYAAYSPDGGRIAFLSDRSGRFEIWVANSDGSGVSQLTSVGVSSLSPPLWSPDGSAIAFTAPINGQDEVFSIRSSGGEARQLTSGPEAKVELGWSTDSKRVYFGTPTRTMKVPSSGGMPVAADPKEISPPRGWYQTAGGFVYLPQGNEPMELWKYPVQSEPGLLGRLFSGSDTSGQQAGGVQVLPAIFHGSAYWVTEQGVYFVPRANRTTIQFLRFSTGKIEKIVDLGKEAYYGLTVSPDGRWLVYSEIEQQGSNLMLVDKFR